MASIDLVRRLVYSALAVAATTTLRAEPGKVLLLGRSVDIDCVTQRDVDLAFDEAGNYRASERQEAALKLKRCLDSKSEGYERAKLRTDGEDVSLSRFEQWRLEAAHRVTVTGGQEDFTAGFGVGFGFSYRPDAVVSEATVDATRIVRATESKRSEPRVILEAHYYGLCRSKACNKGDFGVGPFFGVVAKDDKLISAFGAGVMFGWRDKKAGDKTGFSVGLGGLLDADVKSLAPGFEDGQPLPAGETAPRFETKSRWSTILFFTRTF